MSVSMSSHHLAEAPEASRTNIEAPRSLARRCLHSATKAALLLVSPALAAFDTLDARPLGVLLLLRARLLMRGDGRARSRRELKRRAYAALTSRRSVALALPLLAALALLLVGALLLAALPMVSSSSQSARRRTLWASPSAPSLTGPTCISSTLFGGGVGGA